MYLKVIHSAYNFFFKILATSASSSVRQTVQIEFFYVHTNGSLTRKEKGFRFKVTTGALYWSFVPSRIPFPGLSPLCHTMSGLIWNVRLVSNSAFVYRGEAHLTCDTTQKLQEKIEEKYIKEKKMGNPGTTNTNWQFNSFLERRKEMGETHGLHTSLSGHEKNCNSLQTLQVQFRDKIPCCTRFFACSETTVSIYIVCLSDKENWSLFYANSSPT